MNKKTIPLLLTFLLAGCSNADTNNVEKLAIADHDLTLKTSDCSLSSNGEIIETQVQGNCHFVRNFEGTKIKTKYYADIDAHVAIIVSNVPFKDEDYPYTLERNDCGNVLKAILVAKDGVSTLDKVFENFVVCAQTGIDEKVYYLLSH